MVSMAALCGTRIRYSRLRVHLVGGDLVGGIEECGDSSCCRFHGVVDLVQSTRFRGLVLELRSFGSIQWFNGGDFGLWGAGS
jgi:hypothetical protein